MSRETIRRARATPVRVPAKPDSLNSPGIDEESEKESSFAAKFKTGARWSSFADQVKWIVELETADGLVGIGETYRSVDAGAVRSALSAVLGRDAVALPWRRLPVADMRVYDAIETAVLDLAGRTLGVPIHQLLGGACRDRVECLAWTGRRTPEDAARKAEEALHRGYRMFKFKCSDTDPVRDWFAAIQGRCGDRMKVILDPNQRWHDVSTTLKMLERAPLDLLYCLEDPVDRQDYAAFRELRERLKVPIFIHVSVPYWHQGQKAEDTITVLRERCADGFNFNGPMFEFVRLAETAALAGLPCWHGSEVDLGILEVSALHACAAAPGCTVPSDLFGELVRVDDLIEPGIVFEGGYARVPNGPGLGVALDRKALAAYRVGEAVEIAA